ncbi:MAG: transcription-repair coupling factor [Chloroflexia bacterium]
MSLSGLLPLLYDRREYAATARRVAAGESASVEAPLDAARPYLLSAMHDQVTAPQGRPMIVVTPRSDRARQLYEGLLAYSPPGTPIYHFPAPDLLPYERIAPDPTITGERLRVLANLGVGGRDDGRWTVDDGDKDRDSGSSSVGATGTGAHTPSSIVHRPSSATGPQPVAPIIVTSVFALMQPTMAPPDMAHAVRVLRRGERVNLHELLAHLVDLGYQSSVLVEEPGQFSRRGGIIDLFPPTSSLPIRVELFGDEIDSIRVFSPLTQRSERQANSLLVTPSCELPLWRREQAASQLRQLDTSGLREEVLEEWTVDMDKVASGDCFEGMELFMPYYVDQLASLADYLPIMGARGQGRDDGRWTMDDEVVGSASSIVHRPSSAQPLLVLDDLELIRLEAQEIERQAGELYAGFVDNGELPASLKRPYLSWEEVSAHGRGLPTLAIGSAPDSPSQGALEAPTFAPLRLYAGNIGAAIADLKAMREQKSRVVIVSQQSSRLRELLEDEDIYPTLRKGAAAGPRSAAGGSSTDGYVAGVDAVALSEGGTGISETLSAPPSPGSINLLQGSLQMGWQLMAGPVADLVVLSDTELFGRSQVAAHRQPGPARRSTADAAAILREKMLLELQTGDYVVHVEHGIAKYGGLVRMNSEGTEREYMLLLYAEGDRLYVPADQTDRVAPYIGAGAPPHLHRLGTAEWSRTKRRVKEATDLLARELLKLYAAREMAPGHAYAQDSPWQFELEESFPYVETPDQLRAISEVKTDMEQPRPMDRLICGDVGYGKTEVALRAAFKAVMDGRQVAVLVPTTVLAQQHYTTFSERLAAFPVSVAMLSRFRSRQDQARIVKELGEGKIDIIVGTHMLLSKNVQFRNLGLVVIDEEQRFGVRHKEILKQLRAEVDVITLSATPIPRTLHMAISGVRDLSLIETPPEARLPIKTYVTAFRPQLVREVILREMERGGQVFFVHNRVETIYKLRDELEALVPEARVVVGHGQMPEDHLEKVMAEFVAGKADVLLCTTIIESGLDIPNANTLIVDHADKLGLAQLYQLRGRVGRGTNRAYSYFLYHAGRKVTETARERLSTIEQATELGAGFRIALKDLEIRGAGNLLGPEQSGHVAAVGFDLYTRLLAAAVEKARSERRQAAGSGVRARGSGVGGGTQIPVPDARPPSPDADEAPGVSLDLPITAYLPEDYVPDDVVRLRLYQRMAASMSPTQVRDLARELEDRFGPLPEPAANLLEVVRLKGLAIAASVESIRALANEFALQTAEEHVIPESLRARLQRKYPNLVKVSPHQVRIFRAQAGSKWQDVLTGVLEEMGEWQIKI